MRRIWYLKEGHWCEATGGNLKNKFTKTNK